MPAPVARTSPPYSGIMERDLKTKKLSGMLSKELSKELLKEIHLDFVVKEEEEKSFTPCLTSRDTV